VLPEDPNDWRIGKANMTDAESDRKILVGLLGKGGRENTPGTAAKAQASYDCWLEQLEEGWQIEHIEACRQGFLAAVAKMLSARAAMAPPPASKPMMAAAPAKPAPKPMAPKPATFTVYFYYDSAGLNPNFAPVLRKILGAARKRGMGLKIDIVGYTDTAGSAKYNQKLSLERANTVSRGLGRLGMPTGPMTVAGRGETELKIKTKDGVQEPGNRRVVITVR
jgi:OOP family OmpA-OmpF porin